MNTHLNSEGQECKQVIWRRVNGEGKYGRCIFLEVRGDGKLKPIGGKGMRENNGRITVGMNLTGVRSTHVWKHHTKCLVQLSFTNKRLKK
jgi:hypothetical protein